MKIGVVEQHPWLRINPVFLFKLWFREKRFMRSIMDRQQDVTSPMISEFHQSLVAENFNFLRGVFACELLQHNVENGCHKTQSKVLSGDVLYVEEGQVQDLSEGLFIFEKRTNHMIDEKAIDCVR